MLGILYRYSHPIEPLRWLYVGQGAKRDKQHRYGKTSFGKRFLRDFSGIELPQPVKEKFTDVSQIELNALETFWIHCYKTWYEDGGYNLTAPGSDDYKKWAISGGKIRAKSLTSEHQRAAGKLGAAKRYELYGNPATFEGRSKTGRKNIESGHLARLRTSEHQSSACRKRNELYGTPETPESCANGGRAASHLVWHIRRGIVNPNCKLCKEQ